MPPMHEEIGYRGGLHAAHGLEFAGLLAVQQFTVLAQDGQGRNTFPQRDRRSAAQYPDSRPTVLC